MALIPNKQIKQQYEIVSTISAGLSLLGTEVKSIKTGKASLLGSKVLIRGGEAFLVGANIPPYQEKNVSNDYDPVRTRKLLLTKKEIAQLINKTESKNLTMVPVSIYNKGRRLKLEVGIGKKKQQKDKRELLKKKDAEKKIRRHLKN